MDFKSLKNKVLETIRNYEHGIHEWLDSGYKKLDEDVKLTFVTSSPHYDGHDCHTIYAHDNDGETIYIQFNGYYNSYEGAEWELESTRQVKPVMKKLTVYQTDSARSNDEYKEIALKIQQKIDELNQDERRNGDGFYDFVEEGGYKDLNLKHVESSPRYNGYDCHDVFEHLGPNGEKIYIKFSGHYTSYDGTEIDDFSQAFPYHKTETEYENV